MRVRFLSTFDGLVHVGRLVDIIRGVAFVEVGPGQVVAVRATNVFGGV
jgi:hypothetical protein